MVGKTPEYTKAVEEVKRLNSKPSDNEQLQLYGLYKIAEGNQFNLNDPPKKPGVFEMAKRSMYNAWEHQVRQGTSVEEAQKEYAALVEKHKQTYGFSG